MLSEVLKHRRIELELTQEEVAEHLHVARQTVSSWETGKSIPDVPMMLTLSSFYHLSLDYMLKGGSVMKKMYIPNRLLDIKEDYVVKDELGEIAYSVDRKMSLITRKNFVILNAFGKKVGIISKQRSNFSWLDYQRIFLRMDGFQEVSFLEGMYLFRSNYEISGEGLVINGNWLGNHFLILKDQREVAQVDKQPKEAGGSYVLMIQDDYLEPLLVGFMITVALVREWEFHAESSVDSDEGK